MGKKGSDAIGIIQGLCSLIPYQPPIGSNIIVPAEVSKIGNVECLRFALNVLLINCLEGSRKAY